MYNRSQFYSFATYGWHKGFYNDDDYIKSLCNIDYTNFFEKPTDEDFPYDSADVLLCGSCDAFSLALHEIFNYNVYIIEGTKKPGFHSFCQVYRNKTWYYIDARGITTSFDEFMEIAKRFVSDEYTIRPITQNDIDEWKQDSYYDDEAFAFAKAVIEKYKECYTL